MSTATKTTVREFLQRYGYDQHTVGGLELDLAKFPDGWYFQGNYLRLTRQPDGRIDLIDCNCSDTGSDLGDDDVSVLKDHVSQWLECIGYTGEPDDDDDHDCWDPVELYPLD